MHDDERDTLEGAIMLLSDTVISLHDFRACPFAKMRREDLCPSCKALKATSFIRAGIEAKGYPVRNNVE